MDIEKEQENPLLFLGYNFFFVKVAERDANFDSQG